MKVSLPLIAIALTVPGLALAQGGSETHEPNYLLGCLTFGAIAAVIAIGERQYLKHFFKLWGILVALGFASVLLSAILRRLDIAFGDHPWLVLMVLVAGIVLIPGAVKRFRGSDKTDA